MSQQPSVEALLKDPVPEIGYPLPSQVELHRGLFDQTTGTWQTTAEVRELTGEDEEYLASFEAKATTTYADYTSALLKRAVVNIGSFQMSDSPDVIDQLILGDRDTLFMAVVKATYGHTTPPYRTCMCSMEDLIDELLLFLLQPLTECHNHRSVCLGSPTHRSRRHRYQCTGRPHRRFRRR